MQHPERIYFEKLKQEVALVYRQKDVDAPEDISTWSGKTLEGFQDDLLLKVKSSISTKWFYTHIKSGVEEKLPRVDVLNLLAVYAGYENWEVFIGKRKEEGIIPKEGTKAGSKEKNALGQVREILPGKKKMMALFAVPLVAFTTFWAISASEKSSRYHFCFTDSDTGTPVNREKIDVMILRDKETPLQYSCDSNGCFSLEHKPGLIRFIVKAEYFIPDTISRTLDEKRTEEIIALQPDNYAIMIRIFSNPVDQDREKNRKHLENMLTDDAEIYQVYPGDERGMEMYNKEEFISKLTMPILSLKNIEVISTIYRDKKISALRFIQRTEEK